MPNKTRQAFEMTEGQLNAALKKTLDKALKLMAEKNVPRVYRNELCVKKNQFIHAYPDGKRFLIEQNQTNSKETILREL